MFRFFINDLSANLACEHVKMLSSYERTLIVYRGMQLDKEDFDKLKDNQGKLMSINGYLSASRLRSYAFTFALKSSERTDIIPVVFEILCNITEERKNVIFADTAQFSEYPEEKEILFDLNVTFR
ncbi:unnamed protein product, partial [Adineta steineri]